MGFVYKLFTTWLEVISTYTGPNCHKQQTQGIGCETRSKRHYKTVCMHQSKHANEDQGKEPPSTDTVVSVFPGSSEGNTVLLQTATVWIDTPRQSQLAKCLLDGGVNAASFVKIFPRL